MYVCTTNTWPHPYVYVCMYVRQTRGRIPTCMYACMCLCMYACMYVTYSRGSLDTHTCSTIHMHVYKHTDKHTIRIQNYIWTHKWVHAHIQQTHRLGSGGDPVSMLSCPSVSLGAGDLRWLRILRACAALLYSSWTAREASTRTWESTFWVYICRYIYECKVVYTWLYYALL
jgi:hypothetical protein